MTADRWQQIESLYHSALEHPPTEQRAFVATVCNGDEELRREVESLLASHETAGDFMEEPVAAAAARALSNQEKATLIGRQIGHYKVVSLLGKGGMGEVYLAEDTTLQRKVALKLFHRHLAGDNETRERFMREARLASSLDHPNICTVYEVGEMEGRPFIAMRYVCGKTLKQLIAEQPLVVESLSSISLQVADAVAAAHSHGVIHRDIKAENIMVASDGRVQVLDFGIAKLLEKEEQDTRLTITGRVMGTPAVMSPEQARGERVDARTDIFSFGAVIYEMATGRLPFSGKSEAEIISALLKEPHTPAVKINKRIPPRLSAVIDRALEKEPDRRYRSMEEMISALRQAVRDPGGLAKHRIRTRWPVVATALLLLATMIASFFFAPKKLIRSASIVSDKSIAVLPFENLSSDPNNAYFSDGLSEELIAVLAKIPGLKVIGRNSSFLFKGKAENSASIGQKLGVAQLIEGSVRRQGDRVRIVAEMIRATDGAELWSETYEREVKDIFAVQSEIAQAVVAQLQIKLLGEKPASDAAPPNQNPAAHDALLQSRFYLNQENAVSFRKAINYAEEATRLDPGYAAAWAALSRAWWRYAVTFATDDVDQAHAVARIAADKAFAIDPKSVDALRALSSVAFGFGFDFVAAEKYARRALELAPGDAPSLIALSDSLVAQGRLQEAEPVLAKLEAADPLQFYPWYLNGLVLVGLHRYLEARETFNRALEIQPKAARIQTQFATLDILQNNPKGALEHAHLEEEGFWRDYAMAMVSQAGSDEPAARAALQGIIDRYAKTASFQVAILYAQRHEPDEMFKWLETAYANRDPGLTRLFVVPFLLDYRDDPRFAAFCRKLGIEDLQPKGSPAPNDKSIAVLPFENLSGDPNNAYFTEGIQEEILTRLSKIADLKVISRTSTQHFKSSPDNLPQIAQQLGVANILEGSVQKSGDAVRVNVQLIKAANDSHLWADTYDRKLTDIFSVESEVAKSIADQLRAKLTGQEEQVIAAKPTDNTAAYDAYLRGLAYTLKAGNTPANTVAAQIS